MIMDDFIWMGNTDLSGYRKKKLTQRRRVKNTEDMEEESKVSSGWASESRPYNNGATPKATGSEGGRHAQRAILEDGPYRR